MLTNLPKNLGKYASNTREKISWQTQKPQTGQLLTALHCMPIFTP
jgi:hypothetical protein